MYISTILDTARTNMFASSVWLEDIVSWVGLDGGLVGFVGSIVARSAVVHAVF